MKTDDLISAAGSGLLAVAYPIRKRLRWAFFALLLGVLVAGFWNYHLVDGFGREIVAGKLIGDTQALAGTSGENGWGVGFLFAAVAGLAATFTACNCVVFAMLPGLTCSAEGASQRTHVLRALGIFTAAVVAVNVAYGWYVGSLGPEAIQAYNERSMRLLQAQVTFSMLGLILLAWGIISFGFADRLISRLSMKTRLFFSSTLTRAGLMGILVGFFSVGRPFPVFRDFLTYAASINNPLYGGAAMAIQGLGQIAVMVALFLLLFWLFGKRIARWVSEKPQQMELLSAFALMAGGAYFVYYWGLAFAFDIGRWGFKLQWYG
ncbi:hypothetical protein LOK74_02705 [Brevibacillus humidisoli]|uniref:cytochrome c biogenesis protein CcdA n=1 Tax=Brevibacillus humidisoli TaxID=2895522 RepID=UPI001E3426AA|nr:hypothetical protein [Brevibacillus humidisoli]UFJ41466.1 hypothetical protein LOK74_02705 [Brevibacillus humidisoli]